MSAPPLPNIESVLNRRADGHLSEESANQQIDSLLAGRSRLEWISHLRLWSLVLGFALLISGVVYFFAYNWEALGRFQKFALLESLVSALFLGAFLRGVDSKVGAVLLTSASVAVGVLLAVIGQVYQTGADSYLLFLMWSALLLAWCVAGRSNSLWVLEFSLINTTFFLWCDQAISGDSTIFLVGCLLLNLLLALVWGRSRKQRDWMDGSLDDLLLFTGLTPITLATSYYLIDPADEIAVTLPLLLLVCGYIWKFRKSSLAGRVLLSACGLSLGTAISIKTFMNADILGALFVGLSIMGQLALIVKWLKAFKKSQDSTPDIEEADSLAHEDKHSSDPQMPWYVHLLIGAGAWFASLFIILFFLIWVANSESLLLGYGAALYLGSLWVRRQEPGEFGQQACLVSHLSGQIMILFGLADLLNFETALVGFVGMALFLLSGLKFQDKFGGFLFGLGLSLTGCWTFFLLFDPYLDTRQDELGPLVWIGLSTLLLTFSSWKQKSVLKRFKNPALLPLTRGFVAGTLALSTIPLMERVTSESVVFLYAASALSLLFLSWRSNHPPRAILGLAIFSFLTQGVPTITIALTIYLLGFRARQNLICGIALVALVSSGSYFYYDLQMTLMAKSLTLISSGLCLLGLRMVLGRPQEIEDTIHAL